jgi:hypothetical protein
MSVRVVAVDWSGAKRGAARRIWAAEFVDGKPTELVSGKNRDQIVDYLVSSCATIPQTVIGLDFAFSFPEWFVRKQSCADVKGLWETVGRCGEGWLSACTHPFWGRPGKKRPTLPEDQHYRHTELVVRDVARIRPKSVFQTNGAGAVGTGSIRGMPSLQRLRIAGFSIWPFDEMRWPRVVEIWPRSLTGPITKSSAQERKIYVTERYSYLPQEWRGAAEKSEDAFDAIVSACVMNKYCGQLAALQRTDHSTTMIEGTIWEPHS